MLIASDPTSVGEWTAFAAITLVLAGLVGYLVLRARQRAGARRADYLAGVSVIPTEYRLRGEPAWFLALTLVLALSAQVLAARAWGQGAGIAALFAVGAPPVTAGLMNRRDQRRMVIAGVRERSARMPTEELRKLVDALELQYGEPEMRPLRELLPPDPNRA